MNITAVIIAAVIVGGTGLFIGVFLGLAGKKFAVEVDEREEAILGVLPGNNCGGCGYAGCSGLAAAIAKGEAEVGSCPVGGAPVAAKIGEIMGVSAGEQIHEVAFVKCGGTCEQAATDYEYHGIGDCVMVNMMQNGGPKTCTYGCLGEGTCVKACPFDAIHIVDGVVITAIIIVAGIVLIAGIIETLLGLLVSTPKTYYVTYRKNRQQKSYDNLHPSAYASNGS